MVGDDVYSQRCCPALLTQSIYVVGRSSGEKQSLRASRGTMGLTCRLKRWKAFKHVSSVNQAATVRAVGSSQPANLGQQLPTNAPEH